MKKRPFAGAALVRNGVFAYIGDKEEAKMLAGSDAGANIVFHSDYPVSPNIDIKRSIYTAETRSDPNKAHGGTETQRNAKETLNREQSLKAMTINIARAWHQEHRMGSIEFGKLANMTIFDCDFLHDDIEKVLEANIVATIIDSEEVYKA